MDLFTDLDPSVVLVYVLAGPGALFGLLAWVASTPRRWLLRVVLAPLLIACGLAWALLLADGVDILGRGIFAVASLSRLAGLAVFTALLALAALVRPRLRGAATLALLVTLGVGAWLLLDIRAGIVDVFFWRDGPGLVRVAPDQLPQQLAGPLDRHVNALFVLAGAALVAVPLLAAAALRARPGPRGAAALTIGGLALPLVMLAEAALFHVLSSLNRNLCAPMGPYDRTPDLVRMWTTIDEQRILVLVADLLALALGSLGAVRLARAGLVAGNRRLLAAGAVCVLGGAAWMHTRAHAHDTAEGPRRAFLGQPFQPFAPAAPDWDLPDFIAAPAAATCAAADVDPTATLRLAADGEWIVDPDDLDEQPRGTAAWDRALTDAFARQRHDDEITGRPAPRVVAAAIDQAAPIARVRRYLRVAALHGVDEVAIVARHADVVATHTLADIRVDKRCRLGALRLGAGLGALDGHATWGAFVRAVADDR